MVRRACIVQGCIGTGENASYCPAHAKAKAQARNRRRAASGDGAARRLRADVNRQAGGPCARCRRLYPASMLEIDHVTPIHAGGRDVLENLQVLCRTCHRIKTRGEGPGRSDLHTAPPWASGEGPGLWDRP